MIDLDTSGNIVLQHRLHDTIDLVVGQLLKRGGLFQYDSALAQRLPDAKHTTPIKLPWLEAHLKEHFQFFENGKPVDLPPSLARWVMQRWQEFPEYRYESTNPKRRHRSVLHNKET